MNTFSPVSEIVYLVTHAFTNVTAMAIGDGNRKDFCMCNINVPSLC